MERSPRVDACAGVELRRLESLEEYRACVALQRATWGPEFEDVVPVSILKVSQRIGGVTAGAFDANGTLLGFVFGLTGVEGGRLVHWSDMLAVLPEAQNRGLGIQLKAYQRELLLPLGVETMYWTYDPLVARNAHLNLNKLGARVAEYVENMYGDTASALHEGLGTDRFVVTWNLNAPEVEAAIRGEAVARKTEATVAPVLNTETPVACRPSPREPDPPDGPAVRIEVPADIQEEKRRAPELGAAWRRSTRRAFLICLEKGYRVTSFYRDKDGRCFYVLRR